jgi:hypothetical protein
MNGINDCMGQNSVVLKSTADVTGFKLIRHRHEDTRAVLITAALACVQMRG